MALKQDVLNEMNRLIEVLKNDQLSDGSWNYPFETGIKTDSYMIILLRMLEIEAEEDLIKALVRRIISKQDEAGSWKLFFDEEEGNLTTTVEAYYALQYSGYVSEKANHMKAAKRFILEHGGLEQTQMFTKILLAMGGQIKWPSQFPIPVEAILLPAKFPINFYDISVFGRSNIAPILILSDYKFTKTTDKSPDLSDLSPRVIDDFVNRQSNEYRSFLQYIKQGVDSLVGLKEDLHEKALAQLESYMINRIETDGTFYSYFSATFLMIFALIARGKSKMDPVISKAVEGLKSMICEIDHQLHCQYTTANIWNTTLISYVLQEAGVIRNTNIIQGANQYLLSRQHYKYGDWVIHNPHANPGGWGFSNINSINPDVDDTTAALRAFRKQATENDRFRSAWDRGVQWVISMQNDDGGWPAFERNIDNPILNILPGGEDLLLDASAADLTGRTLEFLGKHTSLNKSHANIKKGIKWLVKNQEENGSWDSRWGICYIYGTWAAITGLRAVGVEAAHPAIQKGVEWLIEIQNDDGGWGESCKSDIVQKYVPLTKSTLTHTAWAIDALIATSDKITPQIQKGINFLCDHADTKDWRTSYPMGQGAAGLFYIHYHSYNYIWPLLVYSHFINKFYKD